MRSQDTGMIGQRSFQIASPVFHSTIVCEDFDEARETLSRLFETKAWDGGIWAGRRAVFIPVGDTWVEAMMSINQPDGRGSLKHFLSRIGEHWHSLAWHVEGVQALADRMHAAGVRMFDSELELIEDEVPGHGPFPTGEMEPPMPPDWESRVFFTALKDSHGGLEFVDPTIPHPFLPRLEPIAHPEPNGLGITKSTHNTFVVANIEAALDFWVRVIGAELVGHGNNPSAGTLSSFVGFGTGIGNIVELAQPISGGAARRDLEKCGTDMLHASHFHVLDLAYARNRFEGNGFRVEWSNDHQFVLEPSSTLGARFGFTDLNDPPFM